MKARVTVGHNVRHWSTFDIELEPYEFNDLESADDSTNAHTMLAVWLEKGRLKLDTEDVEELPDVFHPDSEPSVIALEIDQDGPE